LPALAVCYLVAAPHKWPARSRRCAAMALAAVAVSLSWMTLVTIWPAGDRPYVDGSTSNSVFQQVFVYNGFGRLEQATPDQLVNKTIRLGIPISPPPSAGRLLTGELGRDTGWLLAAAVIGLAAGLLARRHEPRGDLARASLLLWGIWLVACFATFTAATTINTYYTAALSPAVAAIVAIGLAQAWQHRRSAWTWLTLAVAVAATGAYASWLLPAAGTGLPGWLRTACISLAAAALCMAAACLAALRLAAVRPVAGAGRPRQHLTTLAAITMMAAAVAALAVPAAAAVSVVTSGLGPFETPFEPAPETARITAFLSAGFEVGPALTALEQGNAAEPYLMATQTSVLAAPFIWASGREVVPVGGFTGTMPEPTLAALQRLISTNLVRTFLQSPTTTDPRLVWVARHCLAIRNRGAVPKSSLPLAVYYCLAG
jgi:hypothetical protein